MARPTIRSSLYQIAADGGYDVDMLAVVFEPSTPQATVDAIIAAGRFEVQFAYPHTTKLFKLKKSPTMSLRDAHAYLRGFAAVKAAAPSVRLLPRQVIPPEGLPVPMNVIGASLGWEQMINSTGNVGSPAVVVAEVSAASGGINVEHVDLWPNIWLNQSEVLAACGTLMQCDPDADGFVTPKDLNNPMFTGVKPPDVDANGRITCKDLIAADSPYINAQDDDGNGFADDVCGWNFMTMSNDVIGPSCVPTQESCNADHDTADAGIMAAAVGTSAGNPTQGPGVGLCWNCRLMPLVIGKDPGGIGGTAITTDPRGVTAELIAAFLYARHNGAHVTNLSAGGD